MIILSRKPGEAIVLGSMAVSTASDLVPPPPLPGDSGSSGREGGSPPACASVAAIPRATIEDEGRLGPSRRRLFA